MQVDLLWLSMHSSSLGIDNFLRSFLHPIPRRGQRSKNSRKSSPFQDILSAEKSRRPQEGYVVYNDSSKGTRGARALAVAVDLPKRERRFRKPEKLQMLADQVVHAIGSLDFFQWLERLKETYGASFMVLVVLGYCIQGFRCFPWLAMSYYFKDNLQVIFDLLQGVYLKITSRFGIERIVKGCVMLLDYFSYVLSFVISGGSWNDAVFDVDDHAAYVGEAGVWNRIGFCLH